MFHTYQRCVVLPFRSFVTSLIFMVMFCNSFISMGDRIKSNCSLTRFLSLCVCPSLLLWFALHLQVSRHERRISQIEQLNQMPLYPTEKIIWDENIVPTEYYSGEGVTCMPCTSK